MRRAHKAAAAGISLPLLIGLLTAALQAWTASQTRARNHEAFQDEIAACEMADGYWWRGACRYPERPDERGPK